MTVVKHCSIGHSGVLISKMLEILIVCGHHSPCTFLAKLAKNTLRYSPADLRFGTSSKLVDEDKRAPRSLSHHDFHVEKMRRISTQIVLQALFVTDINHQVLKNSTFTAVANRNAQTHLKHVLQHAHGLEAHRFSSGIGSGDDENMLLLGEHDVQWYNLLPIFEMCLKQRMTCTDEIYVWSFGDSRFKSVHQCGEFGLGLDKIDHREKLERVEHLSHMRPDSRSHLGKNLHNFMTLLTLQLPDFIIGLHHFGRFYIYRSARSTLVMHYSGNTTLECRCHGNDQTPIPQGRSHILVH